MVKIYDVVILGAGPAGCTAGIYCANSGLKTLVLDRLGPGGQMTEANRIENYPGFPEGIDGYSLGQRMKDGILHCGGEFMIDEITDVQLQRENKLLSGKHSIYAAKAVILATGASPRKACIPGEEKLLGKGIHYCATCDGGFYRDKDAAVLGGGNSAAEEALYLSSLCRSVTLIHRYDSLKCSYALLSRLEKKDNIYSMPNTTVIQAVGSENLERLILCQKGKEQSLTCHALFIAIGREPVTFLFGNAMILDKHGYIPANTSLQTDLPGVFAAGDVRKGSMHQIITAAADGALAASSVLAFLK